MAFQFKNIVGNVSVLPVLNNFVRKRLKVKSHCLVQDRRGYQAVQKSDERPKLMFRRFYKAHECDGQIDGQTGITTAYAALAENVV